MQREEKKRNVTELRIVGKQETKRVTRKGNECNGLIRAVFRRPKLNKCKNNRLEAYLLAMTFIENLF